MKKYLRLLALVTVLVMLCGSVSALAATSEVYDPTVGRDSNQDDDQTGEAEFNFNNYDFIQGQQQFVAVGVDNRGNIIYAADTDQFANVNYVVINEDQEAVDEDDYIDDFEKIAERNVADVPVAERWADEIAAREKAQEDWVDPRTPVRDGKPDPDNEPVPGTVSERGPVEEMNSSNIQPVIDIRDYLVNGRFDFTQFEVNDTPTTKRPTIEQTQPKDSDPAVNIYFQRDDLIEEKETVVEPGRADYYIDIEVGRIAHLFPTNKAMNTFKVADKSIIGEPYRFDEPGFNTNYRAHAYKPGDTTITCTHETNHVVDFVEVWHVHVYCRDISFERDQYVVEKSPKGNQYLTLQLAEFEYTVDMAYDFVWKSSNTNVATIGSGWKGTNCYVSIKSAGVSTITVTDKYGNTRSTLLVVKPDSAAEASILKEALKTTTVTAKTKGYTSLVKLSWTQDATTYLDGYLIYYSTDGKEWTKLKTVKSGTTYSYSHRKAAAEQTYYYKVRGYKKDVAGKTVYTPFSEIVKGKRK